MAADRVARGAVHAIVPDAVDDPMRPSGGNSYDRKVLRALADDGWRLHEHLIPDAWPRPTGRSADEVACVLARIPDGSIVVVDGLIAGPAATTLVTAAARLALVVLVHAVPDEATGGGADNVTEVLSHARAVIATSHWLREVLLRTYPLRPDAVHVAEPGVEQAPITAGTPSGHRLLCVAAVAPHKGHDVLLAALNELASPGWQCRCVGSLEHDPEFVAGLHRHAQHAGMADRVQFTGPRTGQDLEDEFGAADVLVHPSRMDGYGMVVTEALAHGMPVITTTTGGLPEAMGTAPDGRRPGLLVPPGDVPALTRALASWLTDADLRRRLRRAAYDRRPSLTAWSTTAGHVAGVLRTLP